MHDGQVFCSLLAASMAVGCGVEDVVLRKKLYSERAGGPTGSSKFQIDARRSFCCGRCDMTRLELPH